MQVPHHDRKASKALKIENIGNQAGSETVQLYVQDLPASLKRPQKELKGFKKISLNSGQTKTVVFELTKDDLSFYSPIENSWVVEKGLFKIQIGSSSRDIRLEGEIEYLG